MNRIGNLGSLVETFLPGPACSSRCCWPGRSGARSASAVATLLLPVTVWLNLFGGLLSDKSHPGSDLRPVVGLSVSTEASRAAS
jgi:vancomycin resistance protein VanJ